MRLLVSCFRYFVTLTNADDYIAIPCRLLLNGTVECQRYIYTSVDEWKAQRDKIDRILHTYRNRIIQLKVFCVQHYVTCGVMM